MKTINLILLLTIYQTILPTYAESKSPDTTTIRIVGDRMYPPYEFFDNNSDTLLQYHYLIGGLVILLVVILLIVNQLKRRVQREHQKLTSTRKQQKNTLEMLSLAVQAGKMHFSYLELPEKEFYIYQVGEFRKSELSDRTAVRSLYTSR